MDGLRRIGRRAWIDEKELLSYKEKITKSGLFLLDNQDNAIGIFTLKGDSKELYTTGQKIVGKVEPPDTPKISALALRVMINKLSRAICEYLSGPCVSITFSQEIQESFTSDFLQLLNNYALDKEKFESHFTEFIKKANSEIKKYNERYNSKDSTEKRRRFFDLIRPIYAIFDKYLRDPERKQELVNQTNIFHYIAHLLIACGIENRDDKRGHKPVFEKIKRYAYRSGLINHMARARSF